MAGFTPFQFSSKMLQEKTTSGILGGINIGGDVADIIHGSFSWHEMWINPDKVNISTRYIQKPQHTAGSIVTYHYRQENPKLSVSGYCGWVRIESQSDGGSLIKVKKTGSAWDLYSGGVFGEGWELDTNKKAFGRSAGEPRLGKSDNTDNSPRKFLTRLKGIADEPPYFLDYNGIEHYNTKLIKMFTKQFPKGIICEGYYTDFSVPEEAADTQTVRYEFNFVIERMIPISFADQALGMFGMSSKQKQGIGKTLRSGH